jgi:hypothetical protein
LSRGEFFGVSESWRFFGGVGGVPEIGEEISRGEARSLVGDMEREICWEFLSGRGDPERGVMRRGED